MYEGNLRGASAHAPLDSRITRTRIAGSVSDQTSMWSGRADAHAKTLID